MKSFLKSRGVFSLITTRSSEWLKIWQYFFAFYYVMRTNINSRTFCKHQILKTIMLIPLLNNFYIKYLNLLIAAQLFNHNTINKSDHPAYFISYYILPPFFREANLQNEKQQHIFFSKYQHNRTSKILNGTIRTFLLHT